MRFVHLKNGVYKCEYCPKEYKKGGYENLLYHLAKEHQVGEFRHKCDQCDKVFEGSGPLKKHKKMRHEKSFQVMCEICGKECLSQFT